LKREPIGRWADGLVAPIDFEREAWHTMSEQSVSEFSDVRVVDVAQSLGSADNPLCAVTLAELDGDRRFRVVMRKPEADHIAVYLQQMHIGRPLTYDLMASLVPALGGRLLEARVTRSDGEAFYAEAIVDGVHGVQTLDARPSDAINLALRSGAPIRVATSLLRRLATIRFHV